MSHALGTIASWWVLILGTYVDGSRFLIYVLSAVAIWMVLSLIGILPPLMAPLALLIAWLLLRHVRWLRGWPDPLFSAICMVAVIDPHRARKWWRRNLRSYGTGLDILFWARGHDHPDVRAMQVAFDAVKQAEATAGVGCYAEMWIPFAGGLVHVEPLGMIRGRWRTVVVWRRVDMPPRRRSRKKARTVTPARVGVTVTS